MQAAGEQAAALTVLTFGELFKLCEKVAPDVVSCGSVGACSKVALCKSHCWGAHHICWARCGSQAVRHTWPPVRPVKLLCICSHTADSASPPSAAGAADCGRDCGDGSRAAGQLA